MGVSLLRRASFIWNQQPVRNILTNPSFDTASATQVTIRTNLNVNPRGVNAFADYNGPTNQTITPNVAITGHPDGFTTANRVAYTTGANPGVSLINPVISATQYTVSAWIYFEAVNTTPGIAGYAQAGIASMASPPAMTIGVWQKVSWTYTTSGTSQIGFRISGGSGGSGSFLITGVLVEVAVGTLLPFFDGSSAAETDFTHAWNGTANASTSIKRGLLPASVVIAGTSAVIQSGVWSSSSGGKSTRIIHTPSTTIAEANITASTQLLAGKTYTVIGNCRIDTVATLSHNRARRFNLYTSNNGGGSFVETNGPQAPNALGVYPLRWTFTVPTDTNVSFLRMGGQSYGTAGFYQADSWWDDVMVVEGSYDGDYVDGARPFSKWDGSANASTSIGYPQWLYQLAGFPLLDLTTTAGVAVDVPEKGTWSNTEGRTLYTVHDGLQIPGVAVFPIVTYGQTGLTDTPVNQTIMLRQQGNTPAVLNRRAGGGGPIAANLAVVGRNISCWGMTDTGVQFIQNNGTAYATQATVMDVPHEQIRIHLDSTLNSQPATYHVRTIMYRGFHDATTRLAISRYLGNKYGANVA